MTDTTINAGDDDQQKPNTGDDNQTTPTQTIKEINVDSVPYKIKDLPENIQQQIATYEKWNERVLTTSKDLNEYVSEVNEYINNTKEELKMFEVAKAALSQQIVAAIKQTTEEDANSIKPDEVAETPESGQQE